MRACVCVNTRIFGSICTILYVSGLETSQSLFSLRHSREGSIPWVLIAVSKALQALIPISAQPQHSLTFTAPIGLLTDPILASYPSGWTWEFIICRSILSLWSRLPLSLFLLPHFVSTCSLGPHCDLIYFLWAPFNSLASWTPGLASNFESFAPFEFYCAGRENHQPAFSAQPIAYIICIYPGLLRIPWESQKVRKSENQANWVILSNFIIAFNASWQI